MAEFPESAEFPEPTGLLESAGLLEPAGPAGPAGVPKPLHLPPDRYLDRERSWIQFNERVLELAEDESIPLLERVRYLAIFASNLDEFFMVRVAGLMRRMVAGFPVEGAASQMASQVLRGTLAAARAAGVKHSGVFRDVIQPALAKEGIEILRWRDLTDEERQDLSELFRKRIYPVLTPLVVDPSHPFPFISGLSLNLAIVLAAPPTAVTPPQAGIGGTPIPNGFPTSPAENRLFARVKVPPRLPRFLRASGDRYVPIEDVIAAHLAQLFGGLRIIEHYVFRVTRVRELEVDEEVTENLLQAMERELHPAALRPGRSA